MYPIQNRFKLAMVKIKRHSNLTEIWCHGWILSSKYYMLAQQFWKQRPSKRRSFLYTSVCLKCGKMVRDDNFKKERMLRAMGLRRKGYLGGRNSSNIAIIIFCTSSQTHFIGATSIGPGKYHYDPWLNVSSKKYCSYLHSRSRDFVYLRATFSISFCFWVVWEAVGPSESDWRNLSAGKRMKLKWLLEQGEMLNSPQIWT